MKPVIAFEIDPDAPEVTPALVAEVCRDATNHWFEFNGKRMVAVRLLKTEEELRAYQAGELVLYRKPERRHDDTIIYEKGGERIELKQERLFEL